MRQLLIPSDESWHLAMDFDGIFTDNLVYLNEDGLEFVRCSREDGLGLEMLRIANLLNCVSISPFVITRESGGPAKARCKKLKIELFSGVRDKRRFLEHDISKYANFENFDFDRTIYLGNDVNDIQVMQKCKISIVPKDAHPLAQASATFTSASKLGGRGFIREVTDNFLKNHMAEILDSLNSQSVH